MKKSKKTNSNIFRSNVLKIILSSVAIFIFGMFVGYQLDNSSISSIQGFLFNAVGDATDSNATDINATNSNATTSNATDSNAQATDNILFLSSFAMKSASAKPGEKVYITLETSGACNSGASFVFKNSSNGTTFSVSASSIESNPYITIPNNVAAGTYNVTEVLLIGSNSDISTFTKKYTLNNSANNTITITAPTISTPGANTTTQPQTQAPTQAQTKLSLSSISLKSNQANIGGKVYVDYKANVNISSLKLAFKNESGKNMVVAVSSLENNPYFVVPSSTVIGSYSLFAATLSSASSTVIYSKDGSLSGSEVFSFNSNITINDNKQQNTFVYNNEDITNSIITKLYKADGNTTINISADNNPIIDSGLFNAIKGTNKNLIINYNDNQLIFNGKNISTSKSIDASINSRSIQANSNIGKLVSDGIVLDFASNGDLPGNVTARIKITSEMRSKLGTGNVHVYYYNEDCNDFTEIATEVRPNDGYYEFNIKHNSEYILVNTKLSKDLLAPETGNIVNFQSGNKTNLLLIGLGILLIIIAIVVIEKNKSKKSLSNK